MIQNLKIKINNEFNFPEESIFQSFKEFNNQLFVQTKTGLLNIDITENRQLKKGQKITIPELNCYTVFNNYLFAGTAKNGVLVYLIQPAKSITYFANILENTEILDLIITSSKFFVLYKNYPNKKSGFDYEYRIKIFHINKNELPTEYDDFQIQAVPLNSNFEIWTTGFSAKEEVIYLNLNECYHYDDENWYRGIFLTIKPNAENKYAIASKTYEKIKFPEKSKYETFHSVAISKNFAYITCDFGLVITDLSEEIRPKVVHFEPMRYITGNMALNNDKLLLTTYDGLVLYQIQKIKSILLADRISIPEVKDILWHESTIYALKDSCILSLTCF